MRSSKKIFFVLKTFLISLLVCFFIFSLVGCGIFFGGKLGDYDAFEGLGSQYDDIQLQEGSDTSGSENNIGDAPTDSGNLNVSVDEGLTSNVTSFTDVVAENKKSVVEIHTETVTYSQWSGQYIVEGAGSGVIISKASDESNVYHVVTNDHVVDGAKTITVILHDGKKYEAALIGTDAVTDVALLAIKVEDGKELSVATLANPDNVLLDGQDIFVIGNPLGELGGSVSKGIISKTARNILISGVRMELMQIDAAVNPGNSGGGLFDISGNLIGVVNAKYSDTGIEGLGFAIPINTVKNVIVELSVHGYVTGRPGLGLALEERTYSTGSYFVSSNVVYPTVVSNESSVKGVYTDEEGKNHNFIFEANDIICDVNGIEINSIAALQSYLLDYKIGDSITVGVLRKSTSSRTYNEYSVTVMLTEYVPAE